MDTATFTEFSFGYALTDNIIHSGLPLTPTTPVFPSLIAEGSSGGGYDVRIPLHPVAIFLQFKIPQVVRRRSSRTPTNFPIPYLRMHLRTSRTNQHRQLLELEMIGNLVAYATPDFWEVTDLDAHFTTQNVQLNTRYFAPSDIGGLDDKPHYIAYSPDTPVAWLRSEPRMLNAKSDAESFWRRVAAAVRQAPEKEPVAFLTELADTISELTTSDYEKDSFAGLEPKTSRDRRRNREGNNSKIVSAARRAAYLSQVRLGCALAIGGRNE
jgi:hypothetical protein